MLPEKNFIRPLTLRENLDEHIDVVCYGGSTGVIEVYAYGGLPPYQYSIDGENWQSSGHFDNLSMPNETIESSEDSTIVEYSVEDVGNIEVSVRNRILEGEIRIFCRDSRNSTAFTDVILKSPVKLDWILPSPLPDNAIIYDDKYHLIYIQKPDEEYHTMEIEGLRLPVLSTMKNSPRTTTTKIKKTYTAREYSYTFTYSARNNCMESSTERWCIDVFPHFLTNAVQDYDGNWYDAVILGNHVWLANNLKTTHYADGTPIDSDMMYEPNSSSDPTVNAENYGMMYLPIAGLRNEFSDADDCIVQGVAPNGWHIPNLNELNDMLNFVSSQDGWPWNGNMNYILKALASKTKVTDYNPQQTSYRDLSTNNASKFNAEFAGHVTTTRTGVDKRYVKSVFTMLISKYVIVNNRMDAMNICSNWESTTIVKIDHSPMQRTESYRARFCSVRCVSDFSPLEFCKWYYTQYGTTNHQIS